MGETVSFASNGSSADGYLALPADGSGPGVIVVQEWWGLAPQIKRVCDRLADEGFVALAPDLYHGDLAQHTEMDKAVQLMSTLPQDRAARDLEGAVDYLRAHDGVAGDKVGVVGFCMGGMLTMVLAARAGDKIGAAVSYYGTPDDGSQLSGITAPVLMHAAANDDFFPPSKIQAVADALRSDGKTVTVNVYEGTGHAFANEDDPFNGVYDADAAATAWDRTLTFLRANLS